MSEKAALQQYGNRLVNNLQVYLRSLHTHDAKNDIVVRARDSLKATLTDHFEAEPQSTLQIQLLPEETFINNTLLPVAMQDFERIKELTKELKAMGVGELIFDSSVTPESLTEFGALFFDCFHYRKTLETRSFDGIQVLELDYSVTGSAERDSHQVVVWLFSGLLDGLEGLRDLVQEGHKPTMVPFMRHMRLLIDLSFERGNVVRHMCFARQQDGNSSVEHRIACRTFLAVQIGQINGMDRSELMAIGLASILDAVTKGVEPSQVIPTLAPYSSLSDMAPRVMMTVREFELARRGRKAGRKGQLLHAIDALVGAVHGESPATLDDVHTELSGVTGVESMIIDAIVSWLGDAPIGAIATSKTMGDVLIFDHGEDGDIIRCRELFRDGLGDVKVVHDLDSSKPMRFESQIDFEYDAPVLDIEL